MSDVTGVVDTDVVSLVFKGDSRGARYVPHLSGGYIPISFMTLAELERWTVERNWGSVRRDELMGYLRRFAVQHSTRELCGWWAAVMATARQSGRRIEVADAWIAATSLWYDVPLITHNPDDYAGVTGLRIVTER